MIVTKLIQFFVLHMHGESKKIQMGREKQGNLCVFTNLGQHHFLLNLICFSKACKIDIWILVTLLLLFYICFRIFDISYFLS